MTYMPAVSVPVKGERSGERSTMAGEAHNGENA
jgi:hypothetical protein